jgi:hypothetical protein
MAPDRPALMLHTVDHLLYLEHNGPEVAESQGLGDIYSERTAKLRVMFQYRKWLPQQNVIARKALETELI